MREHEAKQRVWLYIKDNPGCTANEVGNELNFDSTPYAPLRKLAHEGTINRVEIEDERIEYYPPDERYVDP